MDTTPLGTNVIVEQLDEQYNGSIAIPDAAVRKSSSAKVIALGTGKPGFSFTVKVGDQVIIPRHGGGRAIERAGKEYLVFPESDLLAVVG